MERGRWVALISSQRTGGIKLEDNVGGRVEGISVKTGGLPTSPPRPPPATELGVVDGKVKTGGLPPSPPRQLPATEPEVPTSPPPSLTVESRGFGLFLEDKS